MSNNRPKKTKQSYNFRDEEKSYYVINEREVLNQGVDWKGVLLDVIEHYCTNLEKIANKCETDITCMQKILNDDYSALRFRSGACLIGLHTIHVGEMNNKIEI